ncbi:hypothetical protein QJS66_09460 [Kocuria rhizophila]|nr:hypothetical protein QJS66_09460 [Kocuria rhizophila]
MTDQQVLERLRDWSPSWRWFPFTATPDQLRRAWWAVPGWTPVTGGSPSRGASASCSWWRSRWGAQRAAQHPRAPLEEAVPESADFEIGRPDRRGRFRLKRGLPSAADGASSSPAPAVSQAGAAGPAPFAGPGHALRAADGGPPGHRAAGGTADTVHVYDAVGDPAFMDRAGRWTRSSRRAACCATDWACTMRHGRAEHRLPDRRRGADPRDHSSQQSEHVRDPAARGPREGRVGAAGGRGDRQVLPRGGEGAQPDAQVGVRLTAHRSSAVPATAGRRSGPVALRAS